MEIKLLLTYNPKTKDMSLQYDPPDLLTANRDTAYAMLARAEEEIRVRIVMQRLGSPSSAVRRAQTGEHSDPDFGKGFKSSGN